MSKNVKFELSAQQIKYKDILQKQFLEMEIWAISDIDPNLNNTHFTDQSMELAIPGCKNKPIVGFFENNDFVDHTGKVSYDSELEEAFWDVEKGERILGVIRESDPIEIVEKDGLKWLTVRCVLFVQYCYRQIKKLLKDKTKRVSVEITVLKSEMREDGVEEILEFVLNGITILGSKNGKPVIEAIPGAHGTVLEQLDEEVLEKQKNMLSFAYRRIDDGLNDNIDSGKEEGSQLENNEMNTFAQENAEGVANEQTEDIAFEATQTDIPTTENNEDIPAPNPEAPEAATATFAEANEGVITSVEGDGTHDEGEPTEAVSTDDADATATADENYDCDCGENAPEGEEHDCDHCDANDDELVAMRARCSELEAKCTEYESQIDELKAKVTDLEAKCGDYSAIYARMEAAEQTVHEHFCEKMFNLAKAKLDGEDVADEDADRILASAHNGEYSAEDELDKEIAYAAYKVRKQKSSSAKEAYNVNICVSSSANTRPSNRQERLQEMDKYLPKK